MFGNPDWFHDSTKRIPQPKRRQGWLYYAGWAAAVAIPASIMLSRSLLPETALWLLISGAVFMFDLRKLRRQSAERRAYENLHFIGDKAAEVTETEKYRLEIKN